MCLKLSLLSNSDPINRTWIARGLWAFRFLDTPAILSTPGWTCTRIHIVSVCIMYIYIYRCAYVYLVHECVE